jgi:hypothetical protein
MTHFVSVSNTGNNGVSFIGICEYGLFVNDKGDIGRL